MVAATVPLKGSKDDGNASLRGVSEMAYAVRPKLKLVAGRRFEPGRRELVVGTGAQRQFDGLEVGKQVRLGNQPWTVVGVFDSQDATASKCGPTPKSSLPPTAAAAAAQRCTRN
jgi:putative ABC transport system permease protein